MILVGRAGLLSGPPGEPKQEVLFFFKSHSQVLNFLCIENNEMEQASFFYALMLANLIQRWSR